MRARGLVKHTTTKQKLLGFSTIVHSLLGIPHARARTARIQWIGASVKSQGACVCDLHCNVMCGSARFPRNERKMISLAAFNYDHTATHKHTSIHASNDENSKSFFAQCRCMQPHRPYSVRSFYADNLFSHRTAAEWSVRPIVLI